MLSYEALYIAPSSADNKTPYNGFTNNFDTPFSSKTPNYTLSHPDWFPGI